MQSAMSQAFTPPFISEGLRLVPFEAHGRRRRPMTTVLDTPTAVVGLEQGALPRGGDVMATPCVNLARGLREEEERYEFSRDAVEAMIEEYAKHVESLLDPRAGHSRIEYAYSRLLGARGNICRICPPSDMTKLDKKAIQRWSRAESQLRDYLGSTDTLPKLIDIAQRVELGWADSMERYITTLSVRLGDSAREHQRRETSRAAAGSFPDFAPMPLFARLPGDPELSRNVPEL